MRNEADVEQDKTKENRDLNRGVLRVIPIRKRGFHRAIKRGEAWALFKQAETILMNGLKSLFLKGEK